MSTYLYLRCLNHNPPLRANRESGQHLYDLPDIQADLANRDVIVKAYELDFASDEYFRENTAWFLVQHPLCSLGIIDEYGREHPVRPAPEE